MLQRSQRVTDICDAPLHTDAPPNRHTLTRRRGTGSHETENQRCPGRPPLNSGPAVGGLSDGGGRGGGRWRWEADRLGATVPRVAPLQGGEEISPGDNFAGDNFARGKFRHP